MHRYCGYCGTVLFPESESCLNCGLAPKKLNLAAASTQPPITKAEIQQPSPRDLRSREISPEITSPTKSGLLQEAKGSVNAFEIGSQNRRGGTFFAILDNLAREDDCGPSRSMPENDGMMQELLADLVVATDDAALEGWTRFLEVRANEPPGHCKRVAELAVRLGTAMRLDPRELSEIRRGAFLHDIAMIFLPESIRRNPGSLSEAEWTLVRKHPEYANRLFAKQKSSPFLDIPYCHHERWDGKGYPRRLRGEDIPLAARIFTIADVWDALHSNRPYRKAWEEDKARTHMISCAGIHFDPRLVSAFLRLIDEFPASTDPIVAQTPRPCPTNSVRESRQSVG